MAEVQSMEQATCRRLELRKLCPPMAPRREGPRNTVNGCSQNLSVYIRRELLVTEGVTERDLGFSF